MQVPFFTISGVLITNPFGVVELIIPKMEIAVVGGASASLSLPSIDGAINAHYDPNVKTNLALPVLKISSRAIVSPLGECDVNIPALRISASAFSLSEIDLSASLPVLRLASVAINGASISLAESLPLLTLDASAFWISPATVNVTLPSLWPEIIISGESLALSINMSNLALTTYPSYPYNSLVCLNGKVIGFSSAGIYELSGAKDANSGIAWKIRSGMLDMTANRLRHVWLTGKFSDSVTLIVEDPDGNQYEYTGVPYSETEDEIRIKIGKGINSRYITLELSGSDQSEITIDRIRVFGMQGKGRR